MPSQNKILPSNTVGMTRNDTTKQHNCTRNIALERSTVKSVGDLTHCILNRLFHTIYSKSPISILGTAGYEIYIFLEKNG